MRAVCIRSRTHFKAQPASKYDRVDAGERRIATLAGRLVHLGSHIGDEDSASSPVRGSVPIYMTYSRRDRPRNARRLAQWLTLAACTGFVLPVATASLIRAMDLAELTARADQIVVGDVLSAESTWDGSHRNITTTVEVGVTEMWKGVAPSDGRIRIRQLGGTVGDIEMSVHGMARFSLGERALLFLRQSSVVGMNQGKRSIHWDASGKRWLADAQVRSGNFVAGTQGRARDSTPSQPESLDQLRESVRALVRN
jgi:hypothetical protein